MKIGNFIGLILQETICESKISAAEYAALEPVIDLLLKNFPFAL